MRTPLTEDRGYDPLNEPQKHSLDLALGFSLAVPWQQYRLDTGRRLSFGDGGYAHLFEQHYLSVRTGALERQLAAASERPVLPDRPYYVIIESAHQIVGWRAFEDAFAAVRAAECAYAETQALLDATSSRAAGQFARAIGMPRSEIASMYFAVRYPWLAQSTAVRYASELINGWRDHENKGAAPILVAWHLQHG